MESEPESQKSAGVGIEKIQLELESESKRYAGFGIVEAESNPGLIYSHIVKILPSLLPRLYTEESSTNIHVLALHLLHRFDHVIIFIFFIIVSHFGFIKVETTVQAMIPTSLHNWLNWNWFAIEKK